MKYLGKTPPNHVTCANDDCECKSHHYRHSLIEAANAVSKIGPENINELDKLEKMLRISAGVEKP